MPCSGRLVVEQMSRGFTVLDIDPKILEARLTMLQNLSSTYSPKVEATWDTPLLTHSIESSHLFVSIRLKSWQVLRWGLAHQPPTSCKPRVGLSSSTIRIIGQYIEADRTDL